MATTGPSVAQRLLDLGGIRPEDGDHPARTLFGGLGEEAVALRHEPEARLEVEATGRVGRAVLAQRVSRHNVGTHLQDAALVGVVGRAGEDLDLVGDALPDDALDLRHHLGRGLGHPAALPRKYERSHVCPPDLDITEIRPYPEGVGRVVPQERRLAGALVQPALVSQSAFQPAVFDGLSASCC